MAKQTELRELTNSLANAIRSGNERLAYEKQQKLFSLFADLERELQGTRNIASERLHGIQALQRRLEARQTLEHRPFDLEAAKRGEPIEVLMTFDDYYEKEFIGTFKGVNGIEMVTYLHDGKPDFTPSNQVRMKAPEQLTAYVNAYRMANGLTYFGVQASEDNAKDTAARVAYATTVLAVAIPVKITVNK